MSSGRRIRRWSIAGVAVLVLAAAAAPFVHADIFRDRIQQALERSLHRRVQIDSVHFSLLTGPAFVLERVLIHEDPAVGLEPFAFVESMDAKIRLSSLFTRHLEFSSLTLDDPSVNLVKPQGQSWNIVPLIVQTVGVTPAAGNTSNGHRGQLPGVKIRGGRIDFKFGDIKSTFYLTNANVDITPRNGEPGSFDIEFQGEPARTDRSAQGFGSLRGSGRYLLRNGEPQLDVSVELERSAIEDLARGFGNGSLGLHGVVSSRATIRGPLSELRVLGSMELADVHRSDLIPAGSSGTLSVKYKGVVDWHGQTLDLNATAGEGQDSRLRASLRVSQLLSQPHWVTEFAVDSLPAGSIVDASRHMGVSLPPGFTLEGKLGGSVAYDSAAPGWHGEVALQEGALKLANDAKLNLHDAEVILAGDELKVPPTEVTGDDGQTAVLSAEYQMAERSLHAVLRGKALRIAELQPGSGNVLSSASVPLVENFTRGKWTGTLEYSYTGDAPGQWSGNLDIRDASVEVPGLAAPVELASAAVEMNGSQVTVSRIRATTSGIAFSGEYRYEPEAQSPHRFALVIPAMDLFEAEQALLPTLRREQGFLARTLRRPVLVPAWLKTRKAEGTLRIGTLTAGGIELQDVRGRLIWSGTDVLIPNLSAKLDEARATGQFGIDLASSLPSYKIHGRLQDLSWRGGKVDLDTRLSTRGIGPELLANLRSEGTFDARALAFSPDAAVRTANGLYELTVSAFGPRLKLTDVQAAVGAERFSGQGGTLSDGKLQIELASNTRVLRATGPLVPLKLDVTLARQ